jgi:hypothetical protein
MADKSILDARLAEIDRRLRTIQSGLEPAAQAARAQREPPVVLVPPDGAPAPVVPPDAAPVPKRLTGEVGALEDVVVRLTALADAHERLLVDAHERLLASARELTERRQPTDAGGSVSVSAGPFASTEALRRFERALHTLPEVRSAAVREYEGADRAILDVHLVEPTP